MKITILVESEIDCRPLYLLNRMVPLWREHGETVVYRSLASPPEPTDLAILHSDKTVVAPESVADHLRNSPVINGRALDISKRVISRQACAKDDGYDGPVIIKTDRNSWGMPERLRRAGSSPAKKLWNHARWSWRVHVTDRRLPWQALRRLPQGNYPVLPHLQAVPDWVWDSGEYIVERFVPERDGDLFVTHYWVFLGEREFVYTKRSTDYLVKRGERADFQFGVEVPAELRRRRRELGFDFGKFDWVIHAGEAVLLDANRTPSFQRVTDEHLEIVPELAKGISGHFGF